MRAQSFFLLFLFLAASVAGCGRIETQILETSIILDTNDQDGPYQVFAVIVSDQHPLKVSLVYSMDDWKTLKQISMKDVSRDVFQGEISGTHKPGTQIQYYVLVQDTDAKVSTDPENLLQEKIGESPAAASLIPAAKSLTYRFRILP